MDERYALTNPISLLTDKSRDEFGRDDFIRVIEERQIERITFHYTALDGKLKELKLPVTTRKQAEQILADGERVDGSSLFRGMVDTAVSDLYVVPVYRSAFLNPFDPGSLDFVCRYITKDGDLAPYALDTILHRAYDLFRKTTRMELHALGELEFFLLTDANGHGYPTPKQRGYHSSSPFLKSGSIINEMTRYIAQITGSVKYAHSEVGCVDRISSDIDEVDGKRVEQLEIEFLPTEITDSADNLVIARWLIRNVAFQHGCIATFTPKLEEGIAGNGFHVHMAVMQNGQNKMVDAHGALSKTAKQVIGGLCTYADSLTAFGNTVSSAYLRLVPNQEAPTRICWSDLNRSAMIRVPLGWAHTTELSQKLNPRQKKSSCDRESRQTVELRSPDGSANVHLLLAGLTMAAEWGIASESSIKLAAKSYVSGNIFQDRHLLDSLPALPKSCVESSRIILDKRSLYERKGIFPAGVIDYIAKLLQAENDENMNTILADMPADDRLHETRKIMHKDLHRH